MSRTENTVFLLVLEVFCLWGPRLGEPLPTCRVQSWLSLNRSFWWQGNTSEEQDLGPVCRKGGGHQRRLLEATLEVSTVGHKGGSWDSGDKGVAGMVGKESGRIELMPCRRQWGYWRFLSKATIESDFSDRIYEQRC